MQAHSMGVVQCRHVSEPCLHSPLELTFTCPEWSTHPSSGQVSSTTSTWPVSISTRPKTKPCGSHTQLTATRARHSSVNTSTKHATCRQLRAISRAACSQTTEPIPPSVPSPARAARIYTTVSAAGTIFSRMTLTCGTDQLRISSY
jgi:hypothetical protein